MPVIVASPAMAGLIEKVRRYAVLNSAVLIEGESGAGKEVVARALHHYSIRNQQPWVDLSCAALPEHLVESELFGHEKGAFSGADRVKQGLFELAHGGTLFLDEIGELEPKLQVKLLRVLDSNEYYRVGGTRKVQVNVRVIAATNRDLRSAIGDGWFRRDLYHRLAQLRVTVPPLRQRTEDIMPLAELFRQRLHAEAEFSDEVRGAFLRYSWPGNIRELRNAVMACAAEVTGPKIGLEHVPPEIVTGDGMPGQLAQLAGVIGQARSPEQHPKGMLDTAERTLIHQALETSNGHHERAAKMLGISTRTLSRKLKSYQLAEVVQR